MSHSVSAALTETAAEKEQLAQKLIKLATVVPPMEFFDDPGESVEQTVRNFLAQCEMLARRDEIPVSQFYEWFGKMLQTAGSTASFAIYGSSMHGATNPSDIDIYYFLYEGKQRPEVTYSHNGPNFVQVHGIEDRPDIGPFTAFPWKAFGLTNRLLLFPSNMQSFVGDSIEQARKAVREGDFLIAGIGHYIVHNAIKIIEGKQTEFFEPGEDHSFLERRMFFCKYDGILGWMDPFSFETDARATISTNLDDNELVTLAKAAMRRCRAKRETQDHMATRFRDELRKRHRRRVH